MSKMRFGWYAGASTALAGSVILSAFYQRSNFYSSMVYLAQSNFCLIVLVNFALLVYSSFLYGLTQLCFGRLRPVEVEQLTERAWFAITETCLAMTIFRDEIGAWFIVMFTALVSGKIWGWIGDGRVEVLEQQPPSNPRLFHLRLSASLAISVLYDIWLLHYTINTVIHQARPNMMFMFLFEFAVLATVSWRTGVRYLFSVTEQRIIKTQTRRRLEERRREVREQRETMMRQRQQAEAAGEEVFSNQELPSEDDVDEMDIEVPGWSAKGEWVLWLDLITDMIKLLIYVAFFMMLLMFYGLPIHIIRDLFMTSRDFLKRLNALLRYRRAIQEMNRYPDATEEELAQENTCIICREEMHLWNPANSGAVDRVRPKKLPCGHTLHLGCLKSWLERQQVCPTCRSPVTVDRPQPAGNRRVGLRIQIGQPAQPAAQQPQPPHAVNLPDAGPGNGQQPGANVGQYDQRQQEPRQNRPRIFNLGPLRLGFGANGAQVGELARQFGMPQQQGNDGAVNTGAALPASAPQPAPPGNNLQDAAGFLHQAEQALQREMQSLEHRQQALQTSQLLLAELQSLRQRQQLADRLANGSGSQAIPSPSIPIPASTTQNSVGLLPSHGAPFPPYSGMTGFPGAPARINSPLLGRHGTSGFTTEIPSGSPDLPDGVVIPPGWTLMPLQRLPGGHAPRQPSPHPSAAASNQETTERDSSPSAPMDGTGRGIRSTQAGIQTTSTRPTDISRTVPPSDLTPVVSPSPVVPNWSSQSQLLGTSARLGSVDSASSANVRPEEGNRDESREGRSRVSRPSESSSSTSDSQSVDSSDSQQEGKGKGKAVTLEDVSDDEE